MTQVNLSLRLTLLNKISQSALVSSLNVLWCIIYIRPLLLQINTFLWSKDFQNNKIKRSGWKYKINVLAIILVMLYIGNKHCTPFSHVICLIVSNVLETCSCHLRDWFIEYVKPWFTYCMCLEEGLQVNYLWMINVLAVISHHV